MAPGVLGPQLTALVAMLNGGRYRLSQRAVVSLLAAAWGIPLSVGGACEQVSAALERPDAEAQTALHGSARANLDETS